ncbi:MAG: ATP-binding cassette domain-containing protein [Acidimicrobiales bacterium]
MAVETEGLERRFARTVAVDRVDLAVPAGQVYGFLGPNGAGKSTLVRMLCTLLAPTGGRAHVAGHDVATEAGVVRLKIGAALQEAALDGTQTGVELLALQARLYGLTRAETNARLDDLRRLVDIGDALDRPIETYSGGMKRRLDLAAALVHNPVVLFLDEPTAGLDPASRQRVWEEVRRVNVELGMTIFLTTQYLEEADALAARVGIIDRGRLVAEGTPAELKRSIGADVIVASVDGDTGPARRALAEVVGVERVDVRGDERGGELAIGVVDGAAALSPVAITLAGCGIRVRTLTLRTPTLDDVFLALTGDHLGGDHTGDDRPPLAEVAR